MSIDTVAVIAFDGISPFHLSIPCCVFGENRQRSALPRFNLFVCAAEPGPLRTSAGFSLSTPHTLSSLSKAGIIIVPSWRNPDETPPRPLLKALIKAQRRGALIAGLCLGTYVLAAAGLLDGCKATTHWEWADDLARRYPRIDVDPAVLYVEDGNIITSAGVAAGIDCCLHILRCRHGADVASRVARRMVVFPHRQGGQAQYIEQPLPSHLEEDHLGKVMEWIQKNIDKHLTLDALARRAFMSRRTFTRSWRKATGTSPGKWLMGQRIAMAQRLLEKTDAPMAIVAQSAGFGSEVSFRQHFTSAVKTSPGRYRREFRGK
ncbi:MAG: helix-turn-helix domain-containing protein [Nitrospinae bacterium]|nr:helix-turn-helix domain-containing protein [Nitrospinota bacterium]